MDQQKTKLPTGWVLAEGRELFSFIRGVTFKKNEAEGSPSNDRIGIIRAGNIQNGDIVTDDLLYVPNERVFAEQLVRKDDLIIAMSSGSKSVVGKVASVESDLKRTSFGAFCGLIRPKSEAVAPWLKLYFQSEEYRRLISELSSGININNLRPENLLGLKISLPPLKELKRNATLTEKLRLRSRRAREALEAVPDLLEQLRQSILAAAFRGDLTKEWRSKHPNVEPTTELLKRIRTERRKRWEEAELEKLKAKGLIGDKLDTEFAESRKRYKEPVPVDTADLSELPEGWCWASINEFGNVKGGKRLPRGSSLVTENTGYPYIRAGNLKKGTVKGEVLYLKEDDYKRVSRYTISSNDAYLTIVGAYIGDAGVIPLEYNGANLSENAAKISELIYVDNEYLGWMLQAKQLQRQIQQRILSAAQGKLALNRIAQLALPVCAQEEQRMVIKKIKECLYLVYILSQMAIDIDKLCHDLDKSILNKAFRGELVPQDPNDEPASVLLNRIREEKVRQAVEQKAKGKQKRGKTR